MSRLILSCLLALAFIGTASAAGRQGSYIEGLTHTLFGLDHLIAMIAVGLISSQFGGRAIWRVPAIFVLALVAGGAAGLILPEGNLRNWLLSTSEVVIMLSDLSLVLAIMWMAPGRRDRALGAVGGFIVLFGLFHGFAHGGEIPTGALPFFYVVGFATTSIVMHILGVGIGELARLFRQPQVARGLFAAVLFGISIPYQVDFWNAIMPDLILEIFGF